ncbi:MAG: hypothetical protein H3Z51_10625 [archaeon]|nr:hypothetical protein [archaeon]
MNLPTGFDLLAHTANAIAHEGFSLALTTKASAIYSKDEPTISVLSRKASNLFSYLSLVTGFLIPS